MTMNLDPPSYACPVCGADVKSWRSDTPVVRWTDGPCTPWRLLPHRPVFTAVPCGHHWRGDGIYSTTERTLIWNEITEVDKQEFDHYERNSWVLS